MEGWSSNTASQRHCHSILSTQLCKADAFASFSEVLISMTTGLSEFFKYNLWANLRLLEACAPLSDAQLDATTKGTFGSVRETLMHLFAAEEGYVRALTGKIPTPSHPKKKNVWTKCGRRLFKAQPFRIKCISWLGKVRCTSFGTRP